MLLEEWLKVAVIGLAMGCVSLTLTKAQVFKGMRDWIASKSAFLGKLFQCPFCMSFWVNFAPVLYYKPRVIQSEFAWVDITLSYFVVVIVSALGAAIIFRSYAPMMAPPPDEDEA